MVQVAGVYEMRLIQDDIGMLSAPAYFAGYNWSEVVSSTRYYGIVYYMFFAPILRLVDDPTMIWFIIISTHIILVSFTCTFVFHIGVKYLKMQNGLMTVAFSIISSFVFISLKSLSQEPILFFLTWLMAYLFIKMTNSNKKMLYVFLLLGAALYAYLVHTRAIVFVVAIVGTLFFYIIKNRGLTQKVKKVFLILLAACATILIASSIKDFIIQLIWGTSEPILNSEIPLNSNVLRVLSLKGLLVCFDMFITNMVTASNRLFGINVIALVFAALLLFGSWNVIEKKLNIGETKILILLFSFICFFVGICGVSVIWGKGVVSTYLTNETTYNYKGFGYYRYYATFLGPAIFVSLNECIRNKKFRNLVKLPVISLQAFIYIYFFVAVVGRIEKSEYINRTRLEYVAFNGNGYDMLNYRLSALLAFGVLISLFIFVSRSVYSKLTTALCIVIAVLPYLKNLQNGIFTQPQLNTQADAGYELFLELEANNYVPENIYCNSASRSYSYQFHLKKYAIKIGYPDDSATAIVFSGSSKRDEKLDDNYICLKIDDNEYIWTNSAEIYDVAREYFQLGGVQLSYEITDSDFEGRGFGAVEQNSFAWTNNENTRVYCYLNKAGYLVTLSLGTGIPLDPLGWDEYSIEVYVNDNYCTTLSINKHNNGDELCFYIPEELIRGGLEVVTFKSKLWSPTEYGSEDGRQLGFAFSGMNLLEDGSMD